MNQAITFLPMLAILGVFMFFASRRQKRAMQATIDLHESLRIGDEVQTTSGLHATIKRITDDTVALEIAPGGGATGGPARGARQPRGGAAPPRNLFGAVGLIDARGADGGVATCNEAHR